MFPAETPSCLSCCTICRRLLFQCIKTAPYRTKLWHPHKISYRPMSLGKRFTLGNIFILGLLKHIFPQCLLSGCLYPLIATTSPSLRLLCRPLCALVPFPSPPQSISHLSIWWVHSSASVLRSLAPQTFLSPQSRFMWPSCGIEFACSPCPASTLGGYRLWWGSFRPQNNQSLFKHNMFVILSEICCPSLPLPVLCHSCLFCYPSETWSMVYLLPFLAGVKKAFCYCFHTWPLP